MSDIGNDGYTTKIRKLDERLTTVETKFPKALKDLIEKQDVINATQINTNNRFDTYIRGNGRAGIHTWIARLVMIVLVLTIVLACITYVIAVR